MNFNNTKVVGSGFSGGNLTTLQPPFTKDINSSLQALKDLEVDYIILDEKAIIIRPEMQSLVIESNVPNSFKKVYDNYNSSSERKVRIYKIR